MFLYRCIGNNPFTLKVNNTNIDIIPGQMYELDERSELTQRRVKSKDLFPIAPIQEPTKEDVVEEGILEDEPQKQEPKKRKK